MKSNRQFISRSSIEPYVARATDKLSKSWTKLATVAAAALALSLAFHVVFGKDGVFVYAQKRHESQQYAKEIEQLQQENDKLQGQVNDLQGDPNAIERQAREELHYTRPGEVIVTLPDQPAAAQNPGK